MTRTSPGKSPVTMTALFVSAALAATAGARAAVTLPSDALSLADMSIDQLVNVEITSVSKKETRLFASPAAVTVITDTDIDRFGFTSLPEALRMAPGLDVARINGNTWAISSRGFNLQYSNKLLVLMDGRSIFTPSFGGVYWNVQDMVLDDLDRIEVIRGPGATLWGANAVNGVINITSKNARDTQGLLVSSGYGTEDQPSFSVRYGGGLTPNLHYRVYGKYAEHTPFVDAAGADTPDAWDSAQAGFRADWEPGEDALFTVQGDVYRQHADERVTVPQLTPPFSADQDLHNLNRGANLLGRWTRDFSDVSHLSVQAYFDHFRHEAALSVETRDTTDIEIEHRFALGEYHDIVWGAGYRHSADEIDGGSIVIWDPAERDLVLGTAFAQDEITLVPDRWTVTLGSKFEHNTYTGWEIQPSARLLWMPTRHQTMWAAISHAVSTPPRFYRDTRMSAGAFQPPFSPVMEFALLGGPHVVSERLDAYELGYRIEATRSLTFDSTIFVNEYDHLVGIVAGEPQFAAEPIPHLVLPNHWENVSKARGVGAEVAAQWQATEGWQLAATYSWLKVTAGPEFALTRGSPRHQASLRSSLALPSHFELNAAAYYVSGIEPLDWADPSPVPAYLRVDLGLVWRLRGWFEAGVWGQNLLDPRHPEFSMLNSNLRTEIPRTVTGRVTWRF